MAYRALAEKYAQQLNDANQRIVELETAVADREVQIEQVKANTTPMEIAPSYSVITKLRDQLNAETARGSTLEQGKQTLQERLRSAELHNRNLENALREMKRELQFTADSASAQARSAAEEIEKLQSSFSVAKKLLTELRERFRKSKVSEELLRAQLKVKRSSSSSNQVPSLTKEHESQLKLEVAEMREKIAKAGELEEQLQDQLQASRQHSSDLQTQCKRLKDSEVLPKNELAERNYDSPKPMTGFARRNATTERLPWTRTRTGARLVCGEDAARENEIVELTKRVNLERRRRLQAVALLGPDGRRCKKCCPAEIDLTNDDSGSEITVALVESEVVDLA